MRKVTFGGANSLDNYLARPDHSVDWLLWGDEAAAVMKDFWKTIDTVVMGRKTWEVAVRMGQGTGYPGVQNFVFSRTLETEPGGNVVVVRTDAAEFIRELKQQAGKEHLRHGRRRAGAFPVRGRTDRRDRGSTSIRCCSAPASPCSIR
jgi:dihydrofolate reductase